MIMFQGWGAILSEAKPYPPHKHIIGSRHRSVSTAASGLRLNWRNRNDQRLHLAVLERACLRFSLDMLENGSHPCTSRAIGQERPMKQRVKWKRRNCDDEYVDASNVSCFIRHGLCLSRRTWIRERGCTSSATSEKQGWLIISRANPSLLTYLHHHFNRSSYWNSVFPFTINSIHVVLIYAHAQTRPRYLRSETVFISS